MAKLGDFLTKRQKDELYESLTRHVLNLPNVKPNSWDAFFIIIFLILVADKKIRPAEQAFFDDLINSIFDNNWDSSHFIRGKIPKKGRQINLANKVLSIYEDIRSLDEDALMEVVKSLAANISDKDLRVISLLCISRLAISDLELAKYERKLIFMFAEAWEMENLLIEIKFTKLREETEANFVKTLLNDHSDLIDRKGLSHEQYEEVVHLIHERGLNIPGDELVSEQFKVYRHEIGEKHNRDIKEIRKINDARMRERKKLHMEDMKELNKKFRNKKPRFGPAFICKNFLKKLNFHKNSFDNLDDKFESSDIWDHLLKLDAAKHITDQAIRNKRIRGKSGWLEIANITTGRSNLGRIYYHQSSDKRWRYHVYVDSKVDEKSQKKVFKQIDSWKRDGFV